MNHLKYCLLIFYVVVLFLIFGFVITSPVVFVLSPFHGAGLQYEYVIRICIMCMQYRTYHKEGQDFDEPSALYFTTLDTTTGNCMGCMLNHKRREIGGTKVWRICQ